MKIFTFVVAAAIVLTASYGATAAPKAAKMKAAKTLSCPSCHMPMPTTKSAAFPVPIKVGKTTYYCCADCPSGKKAAAAMKMHKK